MDLSHYPNESVHFPYERYDVVFISREEKPHQSLNLSKSKWDVRKLQ
jgi:hypothetical protein